MTKSMKKNLPFSLWTIVLSFPFVAFVLCLLMPTFDDWTYITRPEGVVLWEDFLPTGSYWRPFDALFGLIFNISYHLFPTLNHLAVLIGHVGCAFLVFYIGRFLGFTLHACNLATLFFYLSPGMLGTVLGIDSLNQVYANLWGLLALYVYLRTRKASLPMLLVLIATFCKENGLAWAVVPPLVAWAMDIVSNKKAIKDFAYGLCLAVVYMVVRILLSSYYAEVNEEYFSATIADRFKDVVTFVGLSWIGVDYVSAIHTPSRNIAIVVVSLALSMPFVMYIWWRNIQQLHNKAIWVLMACWVILSLPHILTLFTAMHGYASLGMAAIIVGFLCSKLANKQAVLSWLFACYIVDVLFVDLHHWQKAYESGLTGKDMAEQVMRQTHDNPQKVFLTIVEDGYPKYSSFCVIPSDAFGWGLSVRHYSGYKYPKYVNDSTIPVDQKPAMPSLVKLAKKENYDAFWIVEKNKVKVINLKDNE